MWHLDHIPEHTILGIRFEAVILNKMVENLNAVLEDNQILKHKVENLENKI